MPDFNAQTSASGSSQPASRSLLHHFRSDRKRPPLHPLEKAVLTVVALHLCFLPWALGTMHAWSQIVSLLLALCSTLLALLPRTYSGAYAIPLSPTAAGSALRAPGSVLRLTMWPRLLRFPIFWLGLALLSYLAIQGYNPSWVWERNATTWWLRRVNDIPWLPTSVDTPFERFNLWRQFIIYASAWLTLCTIWTGFTRRRSLQILLLILVGNAVALALVGFAQDLAHTKTIMGTIERTPFIQPFASFVYKNHAAAYFALTTALTAAVATWYFDQGERGMKKSTPAGLLAFIAIFLAGTVIFTLSRGVSIAMGLCALVFGAWFFLRRSIQPKNQSSNPVVTAAVALIVLAAMAGTARYLDFSKVYSGFDRVIRKQSTEASMHNRLLAYEAGETMLSDHWLRGVGAGGFRYLFPEYVRHYPEIYNEGYSFWEHAHRDWLEIPIELGLAGCLLLAVGAAWWLAWLARHRAMWHSLAVPVLLGCSQTLIHAWFDFPFQCPAILITWLSLTALSARWIEIEGEG